MSQSNQRNPTATAAGGARVPQNARRAPLQCVPVKFKKSKSKFNCKMPTGATNLGAFNTRVYNVLTEATISKSKLKKNMKCSREQISESTTSTIQLLQLSTEEKKLLQLLHQSSTFVMDFFGVGEITEYRLRHSSSLHTRSSSIAALGW